MITPLETLRPAALPASCATDAACQDTGTGPDLSWLTIPAIVLVVVVVCVVVYYARRGGRGL
jgi:hypothetical protein